MLAVINANRRWFSRAPRIASLARLTLIGAIVGNVWLPIAQAPVALADPSSPIAITNVDSPDPVASGGQLTYTVTIVNTGGAKVDSLVLADQVNGVGGIGTPPQLVLTSSQGSCLQSNLKVTCNGGSLAGGATWTVTIRGQVTAANGTTLNNTASVTGTKSAQNFTSTATATTLVLGGTGTLLPDLTISKTGPSSVVANSPYSYTLTVNNMGTANATNVRVVDTLPEGVALTSVATTSLFVCNGSGTPVTVICDGGAVNQGANATITLNVTAPGSMGTIANTAVVDPDNTIPESSELNNTSATVSTTVTSAPAPKGITVKKTDAPDPVNPGGILTYTVVVTNTASTRADDVVLVDGTQGLDASSITASQVIVNGTVGTNGGCTVSAPQVQCSIRSLDPTGTQTVTIKGQVVASAGSTIFNTATGTANIKNQGVSATDSALTTVRPAVDLTVTLADSPDPVCARSWSGSPPPPPAHLANPPAGLTAADGSVPVLLASPVCLGGLTYDIVVGNSGTQDAANVTVRDPLPVGMIFDSYSNDSSVEVGFSCAVDDNNVVTCSGGTVKAASTREIKLLVVAPPQTGAVTNTVTVDPNNAIFEADETNNTATQTTQVVTGVDLVVWKSDSNPADPPGSAPALNPNTLADGFDPIATRGTETYTIVVDNVGTQDVTGIRLRDTLPVDAIFLSAIPDPIHGLTCLHDGSATGGVVECVGGHLLGTESEFYDPAGPPPAGPGDDFATVKIKIFARSTVGTMHNEVRVDPLNEIAEANELNNLATDDTSVGVGDADKGAFNQLKISKQQTDPTATCGAPSRPCVATSSVVTYQIVVTNAGTDPAVNVKVTDTLPAGFTYISAVDLAPISDPHNFVCSSPDNKVINCTGATLSGTPNAITGQPISRTIEVKAFSASQPGTYTNTAVVDPDNAIPEGNESDNTAQAITNVRVGNGFIDLQISKTASPGQLPVSHATPGGLITYTVTVTNAGTDPAFNVEVRDVLPTGTTFVSATDNSPGAGAFTCTFSAPNIDCTGATIDGSSGLASPLPTSRQIDIVLKAPTSSGTLTTLTNQAIVDPDTLIAESNETNNTAIAKTDVKSDVNLTIKKDGPKQAKQNDSTQYVLNVANEGTAATYTSCADGTTTCKVQVIDPLPVGLIPLGSVQATPGDFTCQVLENPVNVVKCVGDLNGAGDPNGFDKVTITIPVFITAESGTLDNQACVDASENPTTPSYNAIIESNELDNCSENLTPITKKAPDLSISKTADKSVLTAGETITYTLTVANVGDGDAAGPVTMTDTLPSSTVATFVNSNPDAAFTCPAPSGGVLTCSASAGLTSGASATIKVQMTIVSLLPAGTTSIINQASVAPGTCSASDCENENVNPNRLTNNHVTLTTSVGGSAIDLVMVNNATFDNPDPVVVGGKLTYTVIVTNAGTASTTTDPAPNAVVVRATLPAGLNLDSAAASGGFICSPAGPTTGPVGNVDCTGDLAAGASTTVTITTTVTASAGTSLSVPATVDPNNDVAEANEGNNMQTAITSVVAAPCTSCIDLTTGTIFASPSPVKNNNDITYNFTVTNVGDRPTSADPAPNQVVVTIDLDTVFQELTTVSVSAPGFSCVTTPQAPGSTTPEIVCTSTSGLAAGAGAIFQVVAHANTASVPSFVNFDVKIDPGLLIAEFNESNNSGSLRVNTTP